MWGGKERTIRDDSYISGLCSGGILSLLRKPANEKGKKSLCTAVYF